MQSTKRIARQQVYLASMYVRSAAPHLQFRVFCTCLQREAKHQTCGLSSNSQLDELQTPTSLKAESTTNP